MKGRRRVLSTILLVLALAPAHGAPRLLVVVSVDQMRADYLEGERVTGFSKGLKALLEQGAVFTDAQHGHVPTETGPGHSVILTGRFPSHTGIIGNEWWDPELGRQVYVVEDSVHGLGPEHLLAYTLGDALKAKDPLSKVVSLSLKDRAAILMGGKKADAAIWFDKKKGEFTTSSYYGRPGWLDGFNRSLRAPGGPLLPATTTHYQELLATPEADRMLLDLAQLALRRLGLGEDGHPDILAVGFSATDYVGHKYGPDSPQMREQLRGVDRVLGGLMDAARAQAGDGAYDLALTADHGVLPVPESPAGAAMGARRIPRKEFQEGVERALQAAAPAPRPWLSAFYEPPHLYLNRPMAAELGLDWPSFLQRAAAALRKVDGIAAAFPTDAIDPADPFAEAYRRGAFPGRSGDMLIRTAPGVLVADKEPATSHGSPYPYDTRVPLLLWGPDFKPGRYGSRAQVAELAPTLAVVLGVGLPPEKGCSVRAEALR